MQKLQVKRKNRTQPKKKTTSKKKSTAKKVLVKKPNQMSYAELTRRCTKYQHRLFDAVKKIVEFDGYIFKERPFTAYAICLFLNETLYSQTTNPYWHKFYEHLEHNPDDREKLKIKMDEPYLNESFHTMNKQKLISVVHEYIAGGAGGKFSSQLEKLNRNFREDTYE